MNKLASLFLLLIAGAVLFFVFLPEPPEERKVLTMAEIDTKPVQPVGPEDLADQLDDKEGSGNATALNSSSSKQETVENPIQISPKTISTGQEKEINDFLSSWKKAWQLSAGTNGNRADYMAFYSADFKSAGLDKNGWADKKAARNSKKEWIHVLLNNVTMSATPESGAIQVSFTQEYSSSNYSDKSKKQLLIKKEADGWKIISEQ